MAESFSGLRARRVTAGSSDLHVPPAVLESNPPTRDPTVSSVITSNELPLPNVSSESEGSYSAATDDYAEVFLKSHKLASEEIEPAPVRNDPSEASETPPLPRRGTRKTHHFSDPEQKSALRIWWRQVRILLQRIAVIKQRRPFSLLLEILVPGIVVFLLLIPRFLLPPVLVPEGVYTTPDPTIERYIRTPERSTASAASQASRDLEKMFMMFGKGWNATINAINQSDEPVYRRCPFSTYGQFMFGPFTDGILNYWAKKITIEDPSLREIVTNAKLLTRFLCSGHLIGPSSYWRPLLLFSRTLDGPYFMHLVYLFYRDGPLLFVNRYGDILEAHQCSKMKAFFDKYLFMANPYLWSLQTTHYNEDTGSVDAWHELDDLLSFLHCGAPSGTGGCLAGSATRERRAQWALCSMLGFTEDEMRLCELPNAMEPVSPTRPLALDEDLTQSLVQNQWTFLRHIARLIYNTKGTGGTFTTPSLTVAISLTESVEEFQATEALVGARKFGIFECENTSWLDAFSSNFSRPVTSGNIDVKFHSNRDLVSAGPAINVDGFFAPYDALSISRYFSSEIWPGDRLRGGFLAAQMLFYSYVLETTSVRHVEYPIRSQNVTEETLNAYAKIGCRPDCILYRVAGEPVCSERCLNYYEELQKLGLQAPVIRYRDSQLITQLFSACLVVPLSAQHLHDCIVAWITTVCVSCGRVMKFSGVKAGSDSPTQTSTKSLNDTDRPEWEEPDGADILLCLLQKVLLLYLDNGAEVLQKEIENALMPVVLSVIAGNKSYRVAILNYLQDALPRIERNSTVMRGFSYLHERRHCTLTYSLVFLESTLLPRVQTVLFNTPSSSNTTTATVFPESLTSSYQAERTVLYGSSQVMANAWISMKGSSVVDALVPFRITQTPTPHPETYFDFFAYLAARFGLWGPIWISLFIFLLYNIVRILMVDRVIRATEVFKIFGVPISALYASYMLFYAIYVMGVALLLSIPAQVIYRHSSFWVIFFIHYLHGLCIVAYGFFAVSLMADFSSSAAANVAAIGYIFCLIPDFVTAVNLSLEGRLPRIIYILLFPCTFGFAHRILMAFEISSSSKASGNIISGVSFGNISFEYDGLSISRCFLTQGLTILVLTLSAYYIDQLNPGALGTRKPWYFPVLPRYWKSSSCWPNRLPSRRHHPSGFANKKPQSGSSSFTRQKALEGVVAPRSLFLTDEQGAVIIAGCQLTKEYPTEVHDQKPWFLDPFRWRRRKVYFKAVDNLSLQVSRGEVLALLGHNGAGKSTLIGMLTGLVRPTSGFAEIMGYNMETNSHKGRRVIGFCPQHNILFDDLTVREHLRLFSILKGLAGSRVTHEITYWSNLLELDHKLDAQVKTLSGGQKRSLSVGLSFTGGSSAVFLDEPSTGMDPKTRRHLWTVIHKARKSCAVLLTTHYMDEADALGDCITIVSEGQICCSGTRQSLRAAYGVGYALALRHTIDRTETQREALHALVSEHLKETTTNIEESAEITEIQARKIDVNYFITFLSVLESSLSKYGIKHLSLTGSTLEDIFFEKTEPNVKRHCGKSDSTGETRPITTKRLQATPGRKAPVDPFVLKENESDDNRNEDIFRRVIATSDSPNYLMRWFRVFFALLSKRMLVSFRRPWVFFLQILIPVGFVTLGIGLPGLLLKSVSRLTDFDGRTYGIWRNGKQAPIPVPIGFSNESLPFTPLTSVRRARMTPGEAAYLMRTCDYARELVAPFFVPQETSPRVIDFEKNLLESFNGLSNKPRDFWTQERTQRLTHYAKRKPRILGYYFDEEMGLSADPLLGLSSFIPPSIAVAIEDILRHDEILVTRSVNARPLLEGWLFHNQTHTHSFPTGLNTLATCLLRDRHANAPTIKFTALAPIAQTDATILLPLAVSLIAGLWAYYPTKERVSGNKGAQYAAGASPTSYWASLFIYDISVYFITVGLLFFIIYLLRIPAFTETPARIRKTWLSLVLFGLAMAPFSYAVGQLSASPVGSQGFIVFGSLGISTTVAIMNLFILTRTLYINVLQYILMLLPSVALFTALNTLALQRQFYSPNAFKTAIIYLAVDSVLYFGVTLLREPAPSRWLESTVFKLSYFLTRKKNDVNSRSHAYWVSNTGEPDPNSIEKFSNGKLKTSARVGEMETSLKSVWTHRGSSGKKTVVWNKEKLMRTMSSKLNTENDTLSIAEDEDVVAERVFVAGLDKAAYQLSSTEIGDESGVVQYPLVLEDLRKVYPGSRCCRKSRPPVVAVQNLTFAVRRGECFGFLGVNGAGKTTTLEMLTGTTRPTSGLAYVGGSSISAQPHRYLKNFGYCPQFETLIDDLTPLDHLRLYLRLCMVPKKYIEDLANCILQRLGIQRYSLRPVKNMSQGNRRKLALCLAYLGDPSIVFLDEPSAGVDPLSRRQLWKLMLQFTRNGDRSAILTTHNMAECEALCDRIGVMHAGRLLCIGSPTGLREKFSTGCNIEVFFSRRNASFTDDNGSDDVTRLLEFRQQFMLQHLPDAELKDYFRLHARWLVPPGSHSLADLFKIMEKAKKEGYIEDYSVSAATLDQLFVDILEAV